MVGSETVRYIVEMILVHLITLCSYHFLKKMENGVHHV